MSSDETRHTTDDATAEVPISVVSREKMKDDESSSEIIMVESTSTREIAEVKSTIGSSKDSAKTSNAVFRISDSYGYEETGKEQCSISGELRNLEDQSVGGAPRPPPHALPSLGDKIAIIIYLSAFAIIGSSLRVYLGRIFGYDCEFPPEHLDYLYSLSTCLTSTGLTEQNGGALFIDLPSNMLGSLLLGIITPNDKEIPVFPWLSTDHRWQKFAEIHLSVSVALCGSITTFSSWNTQMVVMMVGHETAGGTPQVVQAIFGYIVGLNCAIAFFHVGRHLGKGMYALRKRLDSSNLEGDIESVSAETACESQYTNGSSKMVVFPLLRKISGLTKSACQALADFVDVLIYGKYSQLIFVALLLSLFFIGDFHMHSSFHQKLWVTAIFSPPGTILRWKLSLLNGKWFRDSNLFQCFPFGTFFANISACVISIVAASLITRLEGISSTAELVLLGIKVGFAGNLSTVSTFTKEVVLLSEKNKTGLAYFYGLCSIAVSCLSGVVLYSCIVKL